MPSTATARRKENWPGPEPKLPQWCRKDGVELRLDAWTVWTFDGFGRVTRAEIYPDGEEEEARQAAGLTDRAADGHWQLPAPGLRVPL